MYRCLLLVSASIDEIFFMYVIDMNLQNFSLYIFLDKRKIIKSDFYYFFHNFD